MTLDLLARMRDSLQLNGLSVKSQDAYLRAVRLLCAHSGCAPDQITEEHLRRYFLYRRNESRWSPSVGSSPHGHRDSPRLRPAARPDSRAETRSDLLPLRRKTAIHRHAPARRLRHPHHRTARETDMT